MHLLSENNLWITESEFVDGIGNITQAKGESWIEISDTHITNKSFAIMNGNKLTNNYEIKKSTSNRYTFESKNPTLGIQKGVFDIDRNTIYSKFTIENTELNGFEVMIRNGKKCTANGALYNGEALINTWTAIMMVKE